MNKYNQKWVSKLFGKEKWAITLDQTTYYSVPRYEVNREWEWHEDFHKHQWRRDGRLFFMFKYLWEMLTKGYENNFYEVEARCHVKNVLAGTTPVSVPPTTKTV